MSDTPYTSRHASHAQNPDTDPQAPSTPEGAKAPLPASEVPAGDAPVVYGVHKQAGEGSRHHSGGHGHSHRHGRSGRRRSRAPLVVLIVVLALVAAAGIAAYGLYSSAKTVQAQAQTAISQAGILKEQMLSGDSAGAKGTAESIAATAAKMHDETSSPLWTLAGAVPGYGSDVSSVRTLTASFDDLGQNALVPLAYALADTNLSTLVGEDSTVKMDALNTLLAALDKVSPVIQRDAEAVNALPEPTVSQLRSPVEKAQALLTELSDTTASASTVANVLPAMLGANGTRHYLIIAQGTSEIRSTGGFAGQFGTLTVEGGRLELGDFSGLGPDTLQRYDVIPALGEGYPITDVESEAIWAGAGNIPGDVGFIPDFARAAEIWQWMWSNQHGGQTFDGIIGVDPMFLQRLLGVVGAVPNEQYGYTLDGTSTAQILLNQVYLDYPHGEDSDVVFATVAKECFSQVLGNLGKCDLTSLVGAIKESASTGDLQMWCVNPDEEAVLDQLGMSGRLGSDPANPVAGFYVSNVSFGKIDWYLELATKVGAGVKNADGTTTYQVTTTLTNDLDPAVQDSLPFYITHPTAGEVTKRSAGDEVLRVYLTAPAGGSISDLQVDGYCSSDNQSYTYEDLQLVSSRASVQPGETCTYSYKVTTAAGAGQLGVHMTPTGQGAKLEVE